MATLTHFIKNRKNGTYLDLCPLDLLKLMAQYQVTRPGTVRPALHELKASFSLIKKPMIDPETIKRYGPGSIAILSLVIFLIYTNPTTFKLMIMTVICWFIYNIYQINQQSWPIGRPDYTYRPYNDNYCLDDTYHIVGCNEFDNIIRIYDDNMKFIKQVKLVNRVNLQPTVPGYYNDPIGRFSRIEVNHQGNYILSDNKSNLIVPVINNKIDGEKVLSAYYDAPTLIRVDPYNGDIYIVYKNRYIKRLVMVNEHFDLKIIGWIDTKNSIRDFLLDSRGRLIIHSESFIIWLEVDWDNVVSVDGLNGIDINQLCITSRRRLYVNGYIGMMSLDGEDNIVYLNLSSQQLCHVNSKDLSITNLCRHDNQASAMLINRQGHIIVKGKHSTVIRIWVPKNHLN